MLATMIPKIDYLDKKIMEIEVQFQRKDRYISSHEQRRPKDNESKRVKGMLSIILQKVNEHDRVLEEMNESVNVLN